MKKIFAFIERGPMQIVISTIAAFLLTVGIVGATTTISTSITTGGDATVAGNVYATSTVQAGGNLIGYSNLSITGTSAFTGLATFANGAYASSTLQGAAITDYGTLAVTGATTLSSTAAITATTTLSSSLLLSKTTGSGISCIQFYATSSATLVSLVFYATTTVGSTNAVGTLGYQYGGCN